MKNRWSMRAALTAMVLLGGLASGCARSQGRGSVDPGAPRTIIAEPGKYDDIYVADSTYVERTTTTTTTTTTDGDPIGYDTLSDGSKVEVVTYVHSYPEPIETFPRVYWGGRWYYNVNGDFVFFNDTYGGWSYYWGPPAPLVSCWNGYYPWAPYYWGTGFYGAGWYWGGVGYYGYHAYGLPVVNVHHHHHGYYNDHAGNGGGGQTPSPGGPSTKPSKGGSTGGPARRTGNATGTVAHRTQQGDRDGAPAGAQPGARSTGGPQRTAVAGPTRVTPKQGGPTRVTSGANGPTRVAAGAPDAPTRVGAKAPQRTVAVADGATRTAPTRTGTPISTRDSVAATRLHNPGRSSYTTSSGQRITVIDPQRSMGVPTRSTRTVGSVPASSAPRPVASRDPFSSSSSARPSWNQPSAPSRDSGSSAPNRGSSFASPSRSSASSSFSAPSRGSSHASAPVRSSSPSRSSSSSYGGSPSRSYTPPSRSSSSPSRSSGGGHHASPSRSYSPPSRSSGGGHSSPSRSYGGGHSSPSRSSGGGGHHAPSRHR